MAIDTPALPTDKQTKERDWEDHVEKTMDEKSSEVGGGTGPNREEGDCDSNNQSKDPKKTVRAITEVQDSENEERSSTVEDGSNGEKGIDSAEAEITTRPQTGDPAGFTESLPFSTDAAISVQDTTPPVQMGLNNSPSRDPAKQTGSDNGILATNVRMPTSSMEEIPEKSLCTIADVTEKKDIVGAESVDYEISKNEKMSMVQDSVSNMEVASVTEENVKDTHEAIKIGALSEEVSKCEETGSHNADTKQQEQQDGFKPQSKATAMEEDSSSDDDQQDKAYPVQTGDSSELSKFLSLSKECHYHLLVQYLEKNNFKDTLNILKREWRNRSKEPLLESMSKYERAYLTLRELVRSKPTGKHGDLIMLRYPLFVLCYVSLLRQSDKEEASFFLHQYGKELVKQQPAVKYLNSLLSLQFVNADVIFRDIAQSAGLQSQVKIGFHRLIRTKDFDFLEYLVGKIPVAVKPPRSQESKTAIVRTCPPSPYWDNYNETNKTKVYYGVRPDIEFFLLAEGRTDSSLLDFLEDDGDSETVHKSKKKKLQKQYSMLRKDRYNPNAPPLDRIPLPRITNSHRWQRVNAFKQVLKRFKINSDNLPCICFFTVHHANKPEQQAITADINNESTMLAVGFSTGAIRVWSLSNEKLKVLKPLEQLNGLNKDSEDIYHRITDDSKAEDHVTLLGHSSTVSSVHFCPYSRYLLSASFDGTVRLWSLLLWSPLVIFRSHIFPVLCVKFSPFGLYFASSGMDRTARLWSTEHGKSLRMFVGHTDAVDCVQFHPNTNYIATGSCDGSVRLWDVFNGNCVRHIQIEKGANVFSILFSPDGRFLVYSAKGSISFYDLEGKRTPIDIMSAHSDNVYTMAFSQGGTALVSGGLDQHVKLWNMSKLKEFMPVLDSADLGGIATPLVVDPKQLELADWPTKATPVLKMHFTYSNAVFGVGFYSP